MNEIHPYKTTFGIILKDIRFWIILFFLLRLVGITNAPLEIGHNWRQSLTNMIARNFLEGNPNLLYPQIDMGGADTGIIGSEFPFFNYIIYIFSEVGGYGHWYGRLINLIVSSIGIFYFYRLIKKICNENIAFSATFIFLTSIWFSLSRKSMPDTFSVSLVLMGLYYGYIFFTSGRVKNIILYFLFVTLGILCKIPALSLVSVVGISIWIKEIPWQRKMILYSFTAVSFALMAIWYFYWVPYLVETYHFKLYFPKGLYEGLMEIISIWPDFLEKFYFSALYSYLAFICFLVGIYFVVKEGNKYFKQGIIIVSITFFLFLLKTGAVFPKHNYYIIPFTPVMALIAGYALSKLNIKYQTFALAIIAIEGIGNQQHDFFIKPSQEYKLTLESITEKYIPATQRILINGGPSPQDIYFSHRKGWTYKGTDVNDHLIDSLQKLELKYIIIDHHTDPMQLQQNLPVVYHDDNYDILSINQVK